MVVASAIVAWERLARRRLTAAGTSGKRFLSALPEARASEAERNDESFVRWIPIMVPLFAIVLLLLVYLIVAAVL